MYPPSNIFADVALVYENDDVNMKILGDFLETKHYRVSTFTSAEEFFSRGASYQPSIILMDVNLPGMDGLEATRRLRAMSDPDVASAPVIVISASAGYGDRQRWLSAGANEYVSKPIRLKDMVETIELYLQKA